MKASGALRTRIPSWQGGEWRAREPEPEAQRGRRSSRQEAEDQTVQQSAEIPVMELVDVLLSLERAVGWSTYLWESAIAQGSLDSAFY